MEAKRTVGRPPDPNTERVKRQVHLYVPESLAKKADMRRGNITMSAYIMRLIRDDVEKLPKQ